MIELTTLERVFSSIKPNTPVSFDTETDGLYGKIHLAQFYQRGWDKVLAVHNPPIHVLVSYLEKLENALIMHNASYDVTTIQRQSGTRYIPNNFEDTLLMARVAWPEAEDFGLDACLTHVLGYDPYANLNKKAMQKADWSAPVVPPDQLEYAALDVLHLMDVFDNCAGALDSFSYQLDMHSLRSAMDWQNNGMLVDMPLLEVMRAENEAAIKAIALPINSNSWQQVRPYIGENESDGLALSTFWLRDGNKRAHDVQTVRSLRMQQTFLDKFDKQIFGVFGPYARSGRYTCKSQNIQQIPRKTKSLFKAERHMLYSDFAQLELRTIAGITADEFLCSAFKNDIDIHQVTADDNGSSRQAAKTINFNALYGGGANMLQSIMLKQVGVYTPIQEIELALKKWKRRYSGIAAWQERGSRAHKYGRLGSTLCGREYIGRLYTDQLNIENQGTGAEVAKLALHYMLPDLAASDSKLLNFIHDSYIVDTPNEPDVIDTVAHRMAQAMKDAWSEVIKQAAVKDIPMPVEVLGGQNWGDIESGKHTYKLEV